MDQEAVETAAAIWAMLGNPTRIAALQGMREERTLQSIADELGVSRNAVQMQVRELEDRELIYRDPDAEYRYQLTPIGERLLEINDEYGPAFVEAVEIVEAAEQEAREENAHLSGDVFERAVTQRKWDLVWVDLEELLD